MSEAGHIAAHESQGKTDVVPMRSFVYEITLKLDQIVSVVRICDGLMDFCLVCFFLLRKLSCMSCKNLDGPEMTIVPVPYE